MQANGIPLQTQLIIQNSWRKKTQSQYQVYLKKWEQFCKQRGADPLGPSPTLLLGFLTELYHAGLGFSALGTARSAVASLGACSNNINLGDQPVIKRFFRGVFNLRPSRPKYSSTWDVNQVLQFIKDEWGMDGISLKFLTFKLLMLVALVTGQRGQSLHLMDLSHVRDKGQSIEFEIADLTKTSRPGKGPVILSLPVYPEDSRVCVVGALRLYLNRTSNLRDACTKLFISFVRPHKPVSRDTISRWITTTMALAGVDTNVFKPHSTRAAATTAALKYKVPMDTILSTAGWTNVGTFATFYHKKVQETTQFGQAILQNCS